MAFKFRRGSEDVEVTAKDVIGMSEDELKASLGKIDTVLAANDENKNSLEAIKNTLAALEGKIVTPQNRQQQQNNNEEEDTRTPEQKIAETSLQVSLDTKATVVRNSVAAKVENEFWNTFEKEIDELTKNDPITLKTKPEYWQNAYDIIVGRHVKDISEGKVKTRRQHFVEGGANSATQQQQQTNPDEPTDIDKRQAEKFKIPIDKYMATKKQLRVVG